jgi:hypothetical protein
MNQRGSTYRTNFRGSMKRPVLILVAIACVAAGCKKSTAVTAPTVVETLDASGVWTGCITEPHVTCEPVSMTLTDSVLTDTTAAVTGTGNWGDNVVIVGKLANPIVTLNAKATAVLQGWSFAGSLNGNTLTGNMTLPGVDSSYTTSFTRTP